MTTVHAYTSDQVLVDTPHADPGRARAANLNIIPTGTGVAKAIGKVIPELEGKLNGMSMRVPVPVGSAIDFVASLSTDVTPQEVNNEIKKAAEGDMDGIIEYSEAPLVSSDIKGNSHSSIFDSSLTMVTGNSLIKVVSWYDNEFGYSTRVVDLAQKIAK